MIKLPQRSLRKLALGLINDDKEAQVKCQGPAPFSESSYLRGNGAIYNLEGI